MAISNGFQEIQECFKQVPKCDENSGCPSEKNISKDCLDKMVLVYRVAKSTVSV